MQLVIRPPPDQAAACPLEVTPAGGESAGAAALLDWIARETATVEAHLRRFGAVAFRGFRLRTPGDLESFLAAAGYRAMPYLAGAGPRRKLTASVYSSTELDAAAFVGIHSELSYASVYPAKLALLCDTPASEGGATPLADTRRIYARVAPAVRERFETRGVRYIRNVVDRRARPGTQSWQDVFETDDRAAVEAVCREQRFAYRWQRNGSLRLVHVRPAVLADDTSGERFWFNQAHMWHCSEEPARFSPRRAAERLRKTLARRLRSPDALGLHAEFGDGTPMPPRDVNHVRAAIRAEAVPFEWQAGDLLLLDNLRMAHGRSPFRGARAVYAALISSG